MKFKSITITLIFLMLFLGCDDFGDMNDNPNEPTSIDTNPELLLTGLIRDAVNKSVDEAWSSGNRMAQYIAKTVYTSFDLFEWGSCSGMWNQFYTSARTAQSLQTIGENTDNCGYQAIALIMKSWMFEIMTGMWGEIPYTEAMKARSEGIYSPAYDSQETIYKGILSDLDEANTLLSVSNLPKVKGDLIYDGDLGKWRKFANSLRLRTLLRLSNVDSKTDIDVAGEITKILSDTGKYPVFGSNSDNATLAYTSTYPNVHPKSEQNYRIGSYDESRMSETIETVLEAYNDPREQRWFNPSESSVAAGTPDWSGMIYGMVDGNAYTYKGGPANMSAFNTDFYFSPNELEGILMLCSEVSFIKAETAVRYSSVAAIINAKEAYEEGIKQNFEYWKVDMPGDYLQRVSSDSKVAVPVAFDGKIETIIMQKWLSLFYTDYQGFCEFKRTSFPTLIKPGPDAFLPNYPSRYTYVTEEQSLNKENYDIAVQRQGPDEYSTPVWWENK